MNKSNPKPPTAKRAFYHALLYLALVIASSFLFGVFLVITDIDILTLVWNYWAVICVIGGIGAYKGFQILRERPMDPPEKIETVFSAYFFTICLAIIPIGSILYLIVMISYMLMFGSPYDNIEIN